MIHRQKESLFIYNNRKLHATNITHNIQTSSALYRHSVDIYTKQDTHLTWVEFRSYVNP